MRHIIRGDVREDEITLEWWLEHAYDGVVLRCSRCGIGTEGNILCITGGHLVRSRNVPESLGLEVDDVGRVKEVKEGSS